MRRSRRERYAQDRSSPDLLVSETEPLSFRKSAKNRDKNPNSLRRDCGFLPLTQIFGNYEVLGLLQMQIRGASVLSWFSHAGGKYRGVVFRGKVMICRGEEGKCRFLN